MKEFKSLIVKKDKALALFTETRDKLVKLIEEMGIERNKCDDKRIEFVSKANQEQDKMVYLNTEKKAIEITIANIDAVLGKDNGKASS